MDARVVLEEFVETATPDSTIEGDIFICNGHILWDGMFTNKRSMLAPLVPMMDVFPPILSKMQLCEVKETIAELLHGAGIEFGEYNIEMYYTTQNSLFCIEINPRQGGNGIPDIVKKHSGINMYRLLVTTAMGDNAYFDEVRKTYSLGKFVVRQLVFSRQNGYFQELYISPELSPYVMDIHLLRDVGERINTCASASDIVAWVDLEFETREQQMSLLKKVVEEIYPIVKTE